MCVIVYKNVGVKFPSKETLKNCFENNPDGAGYMFPADNRVHIRKGFNTFNKFWKALTKTRKVYGDDIPYVLHFRISTQAHGRMDCTHPFPLSKNMEDLRLLNCSCSFGIAHNGIISLTSSSYYSYGKWDDFGYMKQITYSDTMKFITDYLSLIIKDKCYYKDKDKLELIEKLCDSKLAIMDSSGYVQLIGDFVKDANGVVYSNESYKTHKMKAKSYVYKSDGTDPNDRLDELIETTESKDEWDEWANRYNAKTGYYDFDKLDCPMSWGEPYAEEYCNMCSNYGKCYDYNYKDADEDKED